MSTDAETRVRWMSVDWDYVELGDVEEYMQAINQQFGMNDDVGAMVWIRDNVVQFKKMLKGFIAEEVRQQATAESDEQAFDDSWNRELQREAHAMYGNQGWIDSQY